MAKQLNVKIYFPNHITTYGVGHAALSIAEGMVGDTMTCLLIAPSAESIVSSRVLKALLPSMFIRLFYRVFSAKVIRRLTETYFLCGLRRDDIVHLWPGTSSRLFEKIKVKGHVIVIENINCFQGTSKRILDKEYTTLGLVNDHPIKEVSVIGERESLKSCNYIFSPSPLVTSSLVEAGIDRSKILQTSYGLDETEQLSTRKCLNDKELKVIFVGRVGVRKGIHLLLDYWKEANINGLLQIIGNIEKPVQQIIESHHDLKNIEFLDFVEDIKEYYQDADIFILPSLEEGSPLVTYLALGAGLPCIVSPMGGLGVVTDQENGFIIEPHDKKAWVDALRKLASSAELRKKMSVSAFESSSDFFWGQVGSKRSKLLIEKLRE
jgi:glycosyltransferase involved in cell wall biosynthesis